MTPKNEVNASPEAKNKARKSTKKASVTDNAPAQPKKDRKPKAAKTPRSAKVGKGDKIVELLQRKGGATIKELTAATEWQPHSVRGYLSGVLRKKQGLHVVSSVNEGVYSYAIKS